MAESIEDRAMRREVERELENLGVTRIKKLLDTTRKGGGVFTGDLMLAIGSRESSMTNIAGDYGHGRGFFQMDDRWQAEWLGKVKGAVSGTWKGVVNSALGSGYVPLFIPALKRARKILTDNHKYLAGRGHTGDELKWAAVSAYNCGPGNVTKAWSQGRPADYYTTGGDYAADVRKRRRYVHDWLVAKKLAK